MTDVTRADDRRPFRRVGAALAGLAVVVVLSIATDLALLAGGVLPRRGEPLAASLFVFALAYRIVYGVAGGYLAARLVPGRPMWRALVLGAVGVALSAASASAIWINWI